MRTNLPVTQKEVLVPEGSYLVSKTDLNSTITEVNELFEEISGFSKEELIGQSHNLVRHPDMPPQVFADMWACLKVGMPWRGIVKNRRKDGNHYWVSAQVVPILKQGEVAGYMSVRTAATREQINEAEALYRRIRETGKFAATPTRVRSVRKTFIGLFSVSWIALLAVVIYAFTALSHAGSTALELQSSLLQAKSILVVMAIMMMTMLGSLAWLVFRRLILPIALVRDNILQLAEGDLSHRYAIHRPDGVGRVGNALTIMQTQWMVSIDHIVRSIQQTQASMATVNAESKAIHSHLEHQYERIAATAATTEEFYQSVAEVASSASEASQAASDSGAMIEHNRETLHGGMVAADRAALAVKKSNETINQLDEAAGKIGEITQVIKEIAEQTNLLALNAAIEAARAGETGRGFAVVADEVRKLAERTANSTREISGMIGGIQSLAKEVVVATGEAGVAVESSSEKMRESVTVLNNVANASSRTVTLARHIADASDQQTTAGQDIARNMEVVSRISEENQEKLHGLWADMTQLQLASERISDAVKMFRVFSR